MAEGSRYSSYYIKEQTSGVTPSSGTLKVFRATKSGLDIKVATLQSEEIRDDAEVADFRLGARHVEGTATGELSYETFDDLLGGALRGTFAGEVLTAGIERQSFTFIDYNADITDFPYTIYRGCEVNSLAITVSAEAITGVEFGIVGRTMEQAATLPSGLSKGTRTTTPPMDGFSGKLAMGDVSVDVITEMAINLENGIEPRFVVGSKFSIKPSSKRRQISGTLTAYYEDNKLRSKFLNEQEIPFEILALSAHRTPHEVFDFAQNAAGRGVKVIIAGAGMAAHLPGVIAALTPLPVIGVPIKSSLEGMDAALAMLQMPPGIPVATVAINGALNAAILALQMLSTGEDELSKACRQKLAAYKEGLKNKIKKANEDLKSHTFDFRV